MDMKGFALDTRLRRQVGELFKRLDEFRSAVRVTRIIDGIDTNKDISGLENLGPGQCQ